MVSGILLALGHVVAWGLFWYHPLFWAHLDDQAIDKDGAANSLHDLFHTQRTRWRAGFVTLVALLMSIPGLGFPRLFWWSLGALLLVGGGLFSARFNPLLSEARGLPTWYVSFADDCADFPDAYLVRLARTKFPDGSETKQRLYASRLLEHYSELAEVVICITYGLLMVCSIFL